MNYSSFAVKLIDRRTPPDLSFQRERRTNLLIEHVIGASSEIPRIQQYCKLQNKFKLASLREISKAAKRRCMTSLNGAAFKMTSHKAFFFFYREMIHFLICKSVRSKYPHQ